MAEYSVPSLLFFTAQRCYFHNNQRCDFSASPRPFFILSLINRGTAIFNGSSGTIALNPGDVFFIPMGETYISEWKGGPDMYCSSIFFAFHPYQSPLINRNYPLQKVGARSLEIDEIFHCIMNSEDNDTFSSLSVIGKFYSLCHLLFPKFTYIENNSFEIQRALNYIDKNYSQEIPIKYLAGLCNLSESRFYHVFKEIMGVSPITYKNRLAINYAMQLLQYNHGRSIEEIGAECGFCSSAYFRRVFKKFTGKSPKQYRDAVAL